MRYRATIMSRRVNKLSCNRGLSHQTRIQAPAQVPEASYAMLLPDCVELVEQQLVYMPGLRALCPASSSSQTKKSAHASHAHRCDTVSRYLIDRLCMPCNRRLASRCAPCLKPQLHPCKAMNRTNLLTAQNTTCLNHTRVDTQGIHAEACSSITTAAIHTLLLTPILQPLLPLLLSLLQHPLQLCLCHLI
jgi:hypothetical protein